MVRPLMRILEDDGWRDTSRAYACRILGKYESRAALEALTEALRDESWLIRNEAAVSLAKINNENFFEPLIRMLKDEKPHVREEAAWILDGMKREESTKALIEMLNGRNEGAWMAAIALGKVEPEKTVPSLVKALEGKDTKVRRAAAWALCKSKKDEDEEVRYWAAQALNEIEKHGGRAQQGEVIS